MSMDPIIAIIENGIVSNVIMADEWPGGVRIEHLDPQPGIGWGYDGQTFTAPAQSEPVPDPRPRHITRLAFKQRLTREERIALDMAALDEPGAPAAARLMSASIRDMKDLVADASFIDLDRPDTRADVQALEFYHFLAPGRALEILDRVVDDIERPQADTPRAVEA